MINLKPKEELLSLIKSWIGNGLLVLRTEQGDRSDVARAIKKGRLFPTSFASIMATDESVRDEFEHCIDANRIMDSNRLASRMGLTTIFARNRAVQEGKITKIDDFGTNVALYVM